MSEEKKARKPLAGIGGASIGGLHFDLRPESEATIPNTDRKPIAVLHVMGLLGYRTYGYVTENDLRLLASTLIKAADEWGEGAPAPLRSQEST